MKASLPIPERGLTLTTDDAAIAQCLQSRLGPCLQEPGAGDATLSLSSGSLGNVDWDDTLRGRLDGRVLHLEMRGARGQFDLEAGRGHVIVDTGFRRFDIFIENALRMVTVELALQRNWWLLHSGALADDDGELLLLLGDSGAGKTTLTRAGATAGFTPVNDDLVFVHGESCEGFSALFHRNARLWQPEARAYPVRTFLCVRQADTDGLEAIAPAQAAARVVGAMVTWRTRSRAEQERALEVALAWTATRPVYELSCTIGHTVWEPIRRELYRL